MELKGNLIRRLQKVQTDKGYISAEDINKISEELNISQAHIYGVATFYAQFRLKPLGKHTIKMCRGTACHVAGSLNLVEETRGILNLKHGEDTTQDKIFTIEEVACLGCCSLAPAVMIDKEVFGKVTAKKLKQILDGYR
ncbi:MAG: NADH-quinone oxidoreductase subunit NuoE [Proteobacteria bacterium]|nr:NADH-quinone oxidoreductase subunit NuoE [Pseudomonadota bacterium]